MIKVSVIIPVYNVQEYLEQCLHSLEIQTLNEIEIIMVDDGSTDCSNEICRCFSDRNSKFKLIRQKNGGSAAARLTAMKAATGEYLGFMDADDWAEPDMFQKLYDTAKQYDTDIVFCNCYRDIGPKCIKNNKYIRCGYYDRKQIETEILPRTLAGLDEKGRNHVIRWANYLRIYRHDMIKKYNIYNDPRFRRCQDLQLTFEATLHAQSYFYLGDEYLYHNRVVTDSQSRGYTKDMWEKLRILIETLYNDVDEFKEVDLHSQMDLCAFFFAVNSCLNEDERSPLSKEEKGQKLNAICGDILCKRFLAGVPYEELSEVNKLFYDGFKSNDVNKIIVAIKKNNEIAKRRMWIGKVLSVPAIRKIYKSLRH